MKKSWEWRVEYLTHVQLCESRRSQVQIWRRCLLTIVKGNGDFDGIFVRHFSEAKNATENLFSLSSFWFFVFVRSTNLKTAKRKGREREREREKHFSDRKTWQGLNYLDLPGYPCLLFLISTFQANFRLVLLHILIHPSQVRSKRGVLFRVKCSLLQYTK